MSSGSTPPSTPPASRRISSESFSAAPLTASSPVTANWLAYVPEKPACEFQYESWPGRTWIWSGETPRMSAATCARDRLVALPLRHGAEREDDLAEDVELDRRHLVVPRELELGVEERRLAEVVRARSRASSRSRSRSSFPFRCRLPRAGAVVVDQLERDVEAARVVARVVDAAVRRLVRHLVGLDVVLLPHLDRIEPELVGDDVADPLGQPELLHPRVAAVRRDRATCSSRPA